MQINTQAAGDCTDISAVSAASAQKLYRVSVASMQGWYVDRATVVSFLSIMSPIYKNCNDPLLPSSYLPQLHNLKVAT